MARLWTSVAPRARARRLVLVARPWLRTQNMPNESADSFVYFGHLRHWRPEDQQASLLEGDILLVLTNQLVTMSKIAWRKHRRVRNSVLVAGIGIAFIILAGATR